MSKIQDALSRLRSGEQDSDANWDGEMSKGIARSSERSSKFRSTRTRSKRYKVPVEARASEVPPEHQISADLDRLRDARLSYTGSESELLAQQFRRIKRPVLSVAFGESAEGLDNSNVIMVASALPKSGKTFCSYNLSVSIARERDLGAVLVDADVLKPSISHVFGIEDRVGLIDYLLDPSVTLDDILVGTDLHDIIIVPAGQRHAEATELLSSRRMEQFVSELSVRFPARAIVVDTPPLLLTNEANVLAEHMAQIVFVIEAGETTQAAASSALNSLNRDKPINAIVNKMRGSAGKKYSGSYAGAYYGGDPAK